MAVERSTGWRYVVEEICAAGLEAHLAEPADTQAARAASVTPRRIVPMPGCCASCCGPAICPSRGSRRRTCWSGANGVRLYKSLVDQRRVWIQRIHAELFQHGVAVPSAEIGTPATRAQLGSDEVTLTSAGRQRIAVGYAMIDATDAHLVPLRAQLQRFARKQPACRALIDAHYGIGPLTAVAVWSELGDCRRFTRSLQAVRHSGLDVVVDSSDRRRAGGYLSRQGPATLRWALFEAGMCAARPASPDHAYYTTVKQRHDGKLAAIAVARQLARRCYHTLRSLDPDVVYANPS